MTSSKLVRWSGMAAFVGGGLLAIADVFEGILYRGSADAAEMASSTWIIFNTSEFIFLVLISLGIVGIYVHQSQQTGSLGFAGFLLLFFGTVMLAGSLWFAATISPWIASISPEFMESEPPGTVVAGWIVGFLLFALGGLLFGLASLRASVFPKGAALLLIAGAVLFVVVDFVELPFSGVVVSAAFAWLGYALWSGIPEKALQPEPACQTGLIPVIETSYRAF